MLLTGEIYGLITNIFVSSSDTASWTARMMLFTVDRKCKDDLG